MYSPPRKPDGSADHPVFHPGDYRLEDSVATRFSRLKSKLIPEIQKAILQVAGSDLASEDKVKATATKIIVSEILHLLAQNYDIGNPRLGRDIHPPAWGSGEGRYKRWLSQAKEQERRIAAATEQKHT